MRTRIEGLVQLKDGDAVRGVLSRRLLFWRFMRVDNAIGISVKDPAHPAKMDGVVWVPRANISFVQEVTVTVRAAE